MAAVDVFESEPILQGHPLLRLENAVCTPHIGYVEQDSYELYFGAAFDNVVNFVNSNPDEHRQSRCAEGDALSAVAPAPAARAVGLPGSRWALLFGNFAIGCGVMVVAGVAERHRAFAAGVSVALGGQLIGAAAVVMAFGAPLLAAAVGGWDRRRLLVLALLWYAAFHVLCAADAELRRAAAAARLCVLGAAVFTPQAAAAIGALAPPQERGRAITFIFLGWSLASVLGMPMHSYIGETFGWRWAFVLRGAARPLAARRGSGARCPTASSRRR